MKHITTIEIPALKGKKVITYSKLFSHIDSDFRAWGADKPGKATPKMKLDVFEMDKDATFAEMMSPDNLLTQAQILYLVENRAYILSDSYTFFPFKSGREVFVADVYRRGGRLLACVHRFSHDDVWSAGGRYRVVRPATGPQNAQTEPSDTFSLGAPCPHCGELVRVNFSK